MSASLSALPSGYKRQLVFVTRMARHSVPAVSLVFLIS